jgi:aspartyl/glutamyl-tRNA(Asn/Gln) amidotransferase C subunit
MRFSAADVRHVAGLARLRLGPDQAERFADELTRILAYVEQLPPIAGEEAADPAGAVARRADVPQRTDPEPLLAESVGRTGPFVTVPAVMGHGEAD